MVETTYKRGRIMQWWQLGSLENSSRCSFNGSFISKSVWIKCFGHVMMKIFNIKGVDKICEASSKWPLKGLKYIKKGLLRVI